MMYPEDRASPQYLLLQARWHNLTKLASLDGQHDTWKDPNMVLCILGRHRSSSHDSPPSEAGNTASTSGPLTSTPMASPTPPRAQSHLEINQEEAPSGPPQSTPQADKLMSVHVSPGAAEGRAEAPLGDSPTSPAGTSMQSSAVPPSPDVPLLPMEEEGRGEESPQVLHNSHSSSSSPMV